MLIDNEYLVEIDARNSAGNTVTLRFSRYGYMTARSDTPADTPYEPRVANPGTLSQYLWGAGTSGGSSDVGWGAVELHNFDGGLDYLIEQGYGWSGCAVRIKVGRMNDALSTFSTVFTGVVGDVEFDFERVSVNVRDRQHSLSVTPLQSSKYEGSNEAPNGVDGTASDLKGKSKPRLYGGPARNMSPPLVNAARLIYQISDKPIASVQNVYDGGAPLTQGAQMTYAQLTAEIPITSSSDPFTSADVSIANDTINISSISAFNAGDRSTLSAPTFNPFPSPIGLKTGAGQQFESKTYYVFEYSYGSFALYNTWSDAMAGTNKLNLSNTGTSGITFTATLGTGQSGTFTSANVNTTTDMITVAGLSGVLNNGVPTTVVLSFPASTPILPAPLKAATDYYVSGTPAAAKFHLTAAEAVAGTNAINITTTGQSGLTFTARVYTTGTEMDLWRDFSQAQVNTTTEEITFSTAHNISTGDVVCVRKKVSGTLPSPLSATAYYYARAVSTTVVQLYTSRTTASIGGTTGRVNLTSTGDTNTNQMSRTFVIPGTFCWCSDDTLGAMLRIGTKATKGVTCDATAKATAADQTVAQVLKQIALDAGIASGDINASDVTALDAACSYVVSEYIETGDERSARAVMDTVAASIGAWYYFDPAGVLRMGRLEVPSGSPAAALADDSVLSVARTRAGDDGTGVPSWRCTLKYLRCYTTQDANALVSSVTDAFATFVGKELREVSSESDVVRSVHPGASERFFETRLVSDADALEAVQRLQSIFGARRDLISVRAPMTSEIAALRPGQVVSLTFGRFGLSSGRLMLILGVESQWAEDQTTLLLWG